MDGSEHTPGPYTAKPFDIRWIVVTPSKIILSTTTNDEANAKFAARAMSCHEELVQAVETALDLLRRKHDGDGQLLQAVGGKMPAGAGDAFKRYCDALETLLARAKGRP